MERRRWGWRRGTNHLSPGIRGLTEERGRGWLAPTNHVGGFYSQLSPKFHEVGAPKEMLPCEEKRNSIPHGGMSARMTRGTHNYPLEIWPKFMPILGLKTKLLKRSSCLPGSLLSEAETGRQTRLALSALITPAWVFLLQTKCTSRAQDQFST